MASFSLSLPVRTPSPNATPSNRAEPGLTGSLLLLLILPPVGCGDRDLSPNVDAFEVAICSKCERREETGFCSKRYQQGKIWRWDMIEYTMEEPSKFSSGGSSILNTADTSRAYGETECRPIWDLATNS